MRKAFKASRLIGLLALLAGFMAFSATVAQAEVGAHWNVNGVEITEALSPEIQAKDDSVHLTLLTKVGLAKVEILCLGILFAGAKKFRLFGFITLRIKWHICITLLNGAVAAACKPHSPGVAEGVIETNALDGLIKLHTPAAGAKVDLLELLPEEAGKPIVTLVMGKEVGSECAIGSKFDITGKAFLKDGSSEGLVEKVEHLVEEGPLTALKFGANAATIDGSSWVFLDGAHKGMKFSGIAA